MNLYNQKQKHNCSATKLALLWPLSSNRDFQVLIYPAVQIIDFQLPSYRNRYQLLPDPLFLAEFVTFYTGIYRSLWGLIT